MPGSGRRTHLSAVTHGARYQGVMTGICQKTGTMGRGVGPEVGDYQTGPRHLQQTTRSVLSDSRLCLAPGNNETRTIAACSRFTDVNTAKLGMLQTGGLPPMLSEVIAPRVEVIAPCHVCWFIGRHSPPGARYLIHWRKLFIAFICFQ